MTKEPNWHKQIAIGTWIIAGLTIIVAILAVWSVLRPPDPTHPVSFDFISKCIVVPRWVAVAAVLVTAVITAILARIIFLRVIQPRPVRKSVVTDPGSDDRKIFEEIKFGCRPVSPLETGWAVAYDADPGTVEFGTDASIHGSLHMEVKPPDRQYAIDYNLPEHASVCNFVQFTAKYINRAVVYLDLGVHSEDGRDAKEVWIQILQGDRPHEHDKEPLTDPYWLHEIKYWTMPERLRDNWTKFTIHLPKLVGETLGDEKWLFGTIRRIRLRGTLSVGSIKIGSE
jgi:hypothetical protein